AGVNIDDPQETRRIYQQYLKSYKKGVYNYIKEDIDLVTQETIPRKYFSGGIVFKISDLAQIVSGHDAAHLAYRVLTDGSTISFDAGMVEIIKGLDGKVFSRDLGKI